jgi:PAS domain S-box-containing protein
MHLSKFIDIPLLAELRRSEERLRLAQDAGGVASWEFDLDSGEVQWSPSGYRLYGLGPDWKPSYANFLERVHPEDRERVRLTVEGAMAARRSIDHQFRIVTPDGEQRWIVSRAKFIASEDDEAGCRLLGVDIDITSLKETEHHLQKREQELEHLQRIAGVGEFQVDLREPGNCWYSPAYRSIHGLRLGQTERGEEWLDRVHPDDRERAKREFESALAEGVTHSHAEYRIIRAADGETRWIEASAEIERDAGGTATRLIGAHRDVTGRKTAEEALRRNEQRLYAMLDAMPQIVSVMRPDGAPTYFNRRWFKYTGLSESSTSGDGWVESIHPDDVGRTVGLFRHAIRTGEPFEAEARLRHHSGEYFWSLCRVLPVCDETGRIRHWLGTCTNIHARKLAEERARISEERLQYALVASNTVGVWEENCSSGLVFADLRVARLLSLDPEVAAGGVPVAQFLAAVHPEDRPGVEDRIGRMLTTGGDFSLDYRLVTADGETRWVSDRGRVELDADMKPLRAIGVLVDITGLKQLQTAQEAVSLELIHRMKNLFSVISALSSISARESPEAVREYAANFRKRLYSLSRALIYMQPGHGSGSAAGGSADVRQTALGLLRELLSPFDEWNGTRLVIRGADIPVDNAKATIFALLVHELATNAVKYGSLSNATGTIAISGAVETGTFVLTWRERGGPPVAGPPASKGFGTGETARLAAAQLGGAIDHAWEPEGLSVIIRMPLA